MIDLNKKKSDLEVAKEIAARYIHNPFFEKDGSLTPITEIFVINKETAVYINSNLEAIQAHAERQNTTVTVVMTAGELVSGIEKVKEVEAPKEEVKEPKSKKTNKK